VSILQGSEHSLILNALRDNPVEHGPHGQGPGIARATLYEKIKKHGISRA
jgi:transcriptional regulator of acetoin/glycerol metabolism